MLPPLLVTFLSFVVSPDESVTRRTVSIRDMLRLVRFTLLICNIGEGREFNQCKTFLIVLRKYKSKK